MTAFASWRSPALFHIFPESRIIAGIDASMMMSLGTCRLVMPLSESTIARSGPDSNAASKAASISARWSAGNDSSATSTPPRPLFGLAPAARNTSPYFAKTSAKKTSTAWPKMIGSETFIIVAFMCNENSTPRSLASATCSARNDRNADTLITVESITSPASSGNSGFRTVTSPPGATCSIRTSVGASTVTDCSFDAKSPACIVDDVGL